MTAHQAAVTWQKRQQTLLATTYHRAWLTGRQNYATVAATPAHATPIVPTAPAAPVPAGGLPAQPNATLMSRALSPAMVSLARMAAQIAVIVPTAAQLAAAGTAAGAFVLAVKEYLEASAWLLAGGVSVAWAGEQAGYAEAAAASRVPLRWQLDRSAHHCGDCPALAELPPLPLDRWPTLPGEGATECSVGCKCSMRAVPGARRRPLTAGEQQLLNRISVRQPLLLAA